MVSSDLSLRFYRFASIALLAAYVLLGAFTVAAGRLTGDEGWYTLASLEVLRGHVPYRDFMFTQMPALPYVYAGWMALVRGHGLLAARVLSYLLGGAGAALAMAAARHRSGRLAGILVGGLLIANLSFVFDMCAVKTQALTVCASAGVLFGASFERRRFGPPLLLSSATLMVLTRLSMLPVLALAALFIWCGPRRESLRLWLPINVALVAFALIAPGAPHNQWFGILEFHRAWYHNPRWDPVRFYRFVRGFLANQAVIFLGFVSAALLIVLRQRFGPSFAQRLRSDARWLAFLFGAYLLTTTIHCINPIAFPIHQTSNVLFAVVFGATVWTHLLHERPRLRCAFTALLVPALLVNQLSQEFMVSLVGAGGLATLEDAARKVRALARGDDPIWTPSTEIAVESRLPILSGWELSEFDWFPDMDDARARSLHVTNRALLLRDIEAARPQIVCLTARHAAMMLNPTLSAALKRNYRLASVVEAYGQFREPLFIFARLPREGAIASGRRSSRESRGNALHERAASAARAMRCAVSVSSPPGSRARAQSPMRTRSSRRRSPTRSAGSRFTSARFSFFPD